MSRKDYALIARALREARDEAVRNAASPSAFTALEFAAQVLANALKDDNPGFDRTRFLKAAGA
jgi:hypothetical protein